MKSLFKILLFNFLFGIFPSNHNVADISNSNQNYRDLVDNLADDTIVDLREGNNAIYVGTSGGISKIDLSSLSFSHFIDENLPDGGNPATITYDLNNGQTMIVVSGVLSYYSSAEDANIPYGTGIAWSIDSGENWLYTEQPKDELPECEDLGCVDPLDSPNNCECSPLASGCTWNVPSQTCSYQGSYIPFDWYGQTLFSNPITVDEKNVTYDISVDTINEYIYIASWAGMLRRLKYTDFEPFWELVPLPEDINQIGDNNQLLCGMINESSYVYNPVDNSGNNNHKVFSVHVDEDEVWAGTANGVNKGIIGVDNCIDWTHYSNINSSLTKDWIIDIVQQDLINNQKRIWLIARDVVSPPIPHGITYTDNAGADWVYIENIFNGENALIYNFYFDGGDAYAATDRGLFICDTSSDMLGWTEIDIPNDCYDDTQLVYSYIKNNDIHFVGTPNGLIFNPNTCPTHVGECGIGWCNDNHTNQNFSNLGVYPNPTSSFVNFIFKTDYNNGKVDIFDFSMNPVFENIQCVQSLENDGNNYLKCEYDDIELDNGVYFCRLTYGKNEVWNKLMVINN